LAHCLYQLGCLFDDLLRAFRRQSAGLDQALQLLGFIAAVMFEYSLIGRGACLGGCFEFHVGAFRKAKREAYATRMGLSMSFPKSCRKDLFVAGAAVDVLEANDVVLRSEEHTSELQSRFDLVCRLLLAKKKRMDY